MRQALTDKQIDRMVFRIALFQRRGWSQDRAERFACRLADRDAERDDRRACIECTELQDSGTCFALRQEHKRLATAPDKKTRAEAAQRSVFGGAHPATECITDVLVRCPAFNFVTPA